MADENPIQPNPVEDVEMEGEVVAEDEVAEETAGLGEIEPEIPVRTTFLDYLRSPIVQLAVGSGEGRTVLSAHEGLLTGAPYFAALAENFAAGGQRTIELPDEDTEAVGSVLEFLYNGEYFPKRLSPQSRDSAIETDPTIPAPDDDGVGLLKHARVYTLAEKFGIPALKSLAHSKIHRTKSSPKGEVAYARYVYQNKTADDNTIRKPVAAFWATRSHVLRREAEDEFRSLCLEFPQFGFDVLSLVLDQREKKGSSSLLPIVPPERGTPSGSGRKRRRDL